MSALTRCAGLLAGLSTVAVIGVAVAQSEPPNPYISNHPIAAGQQSTHMTPMGETGVLAHPGEMRTATITKQPEVAVVAPAPEPVAAAPVAPAPEPVAVAPEPAPTTTMGAAPAEPEPMKVAKADRG
ncbi:hypothetical protein [Ramlibacter sp. WS9]|uniref:hypothetical protein n=1 Tax=Ramlibacter sp. WS9 TaxID=1882741 RepID=UPI0018EE509E|nr:hypothetical protein [Ramlibacter sp. WS9]